MRPKRCNFFRVRADIGEYPNDTTVYYNPTTFKGALRRFYQLVRNGRYANVEILRQSRYKGKRLNRISWIERF